MSKVAFLVALAVWTYLVARGQQEPARAIAPAPDEDEVYVKRAGDPYWVRVEP